MHGKAAGCKVESAALLQALDVMYVQTNAPLKDAAGQGFDAPAVEMSQDGAAANGMPDCGSDNCESLGIDKGMLSRLDEGESCVTGWRIRVGLCRTARLF